MPTLDIFFFEEGKVRRYWHLTDHLPMIVVSVLKCDLKMPLPSGTESRSTPEPPIPKNGFVKAP